MAGLLRSESYPPVLGVEFIEVAPSIDDAAPCEAASAQAPWSGMTSPLGGFAQALRPGAARFTCNGGMLRPGYEPQVSHTHQPRFVRCDNASSIVDAPREQHHAQLTAWAGLSGACAATATACIIASPFSAPELQLRHGSSEAGGMDGAELQAQNASPWPLSSYARPATGMADAGQVCTAMAGGEGYMDWPASPADRPADVAAALVPFWRNSDAAPLPLPLAQQQQQQQQDALLLARPALTFSEHPCTLLHAQSHGSSDVALAAADTQTDAAAATAPIPQHTSTAPLSLPPQPSCCVASTMEPCEASSVALAAPAPSAAAPALSSQPSLDRNSGVQASAVHEPGAEPEVVSAAACPPPAAPAAAAAAALTAPAGASKASSRSRLAPAPAGLRVYGAPPATAVAQLTAMAAGRGYKRRAAAAAAAAVVKVAARDEEEEDEDYEGEEDAGDSAGGRGAKRMKKGGTVRQSTGKLVRGGVTCRNCGATQTPQWRCGPEGPRTLCNACGVRFKKGLPLAYMERKKRQMGM